MSEYNFLEKMKINFIKSMDKYKYQKKLIVALRYEISGKSILVLH
jgi:hypothetical protein